MSIIRSFRNIYRSNIQIRLSRFKLGAILLPFLIIIAANYFYPFILAKIYFYFKNGQQIELEHYQVNLPFPKWMLFGKSDIAYVISADKDNNAEIAIDYCDVEIDYLLKQCAQIQQTNKTYKYMSGTEYICKTDSHDILYFLSDDGFFFLRADPYNASYDNSLLYKSLFDTVRKK